MATFRLAAHVVAPPDRVFDLWTNLDRTGEWIEGVTRVSDVSGPVDRVGTTFTTWFGSMASRTTVVAAERPRFYRTRYGNRLLKGESSATFEPDGSGGTNLVQEMHTTGIVSWIFARIFATGSYKGSFRGELNEFIRIVEREAAAAG